MPDALPVPREAIDAFIAEHGVTVGAPPSFQPPPTVAEMEEMHRELAKLDGAGKLSKYGLGKNWRQQRDKKLGHKRKRAVGRPKGSSKLRPHYQRLLAGGASAEEMAAHFGVAVQTVYANVARMGLSFTDRAAGA